MNDESPDAASAALGTAGWPLVSLAVVGAVACGVGWAFASLGPTASTSTVVWSGLAALALCLPLALKLAALGGRRLGPTLRAGLEAHTRALDALPTRGIGWWILLASGAGLFVELALIRWHGASFIVFSHYKNLSLLAAFLGLGTGYALGARRPVATPLVLPALALQFVLLELLRGTEVRVLLQNPVAETLSMGLHQAGSAGHLALVYGFLVLVFLATALTCLPLGHLAAYLMRRLPPLVAYGWNLAGSLLGVGLLVFLSHAWSPPALWLAVAFLLVLPFLFSRGGERSGRSLGAAALGLGAGLAVLLSGGSPAWSELHSPYQPVRVHHLPGESPTLHTTAFFQHMLDLGSEAGRRKAAPHTRYAYDFPYRWRSEPGRVLVVGAGTGNDVAAALRHGASQVTAVEIDPAILAVGRELHPERPYQDPRVRLVNADARNHLRASRETYDMVVYGLLDAHTALSGLSAVRLDSFVYTVEAFREARARLAPGGVLAMTFALLSPEQAKKFFRMLEEAWDGRAPRVYRSDYIGFIFLSGEGVFAADPPGDLPLEDVSVPFARDTRPVDLSRDDWPFVYMPQRAFPLTYLVLLGVLGAASLLFLRPFFAPTRGSFSPTCFFLGAGFMLIEAKGVTELALGFGSTWTVVSAVIVGILAMAFLANLWVHWRGAPPALVTYGLLFASLGLGWALSGRAPPGWAGQLGAVALVTLPIAFAGFAFSSELARGVELSGALASNLFGAMLGGLLEYNAMQFGFKSLYLVALALYLGAFLAQARGRAKLGA